MQPFYAALTPGQTALIVVGAVVGLAVLWLVGTYNGLVGMKNRFKNAFSQIDVQLKRRYDLIPNLVETCKGYMAHERGTLDAVIQARNQAAAAGQRAAANPGDPQATRALIGAETALTGSLGRMFALAEAYPDLKANQNVLALQEELSSTENKVSYARQAYNDSVMDYNTRRESFPTVLLAGTFGFGPAELFQLESAGEREPPRVSLA